MVVRRLAIAALIVLSLAAAAKGSGLHLGRLLDAGGAATAWDVLSAFARPDLGGEFLARIARLSLESLFIGVLGTGLAALFGVSLALVAARVPDLPDPPGRAAAVRLVGGGVRFCVRFLLGFLRAVPDIVWAFLFVRALGLGPGAAVLAIAVSTGGIMGKLFAELAEAVDPGPVHALRRAGAGRLGVLVYGVLPQVQRQLVAYTLFRLECSIRSASILGLVGAGGLGTEIALSVRYFQYDKLATALIAVLVFVIALEAVSARLRRMRGRWSAAALLLGCAASVAFLDVPWSDLWRSGLAAGGMWIGGAAGAMGVARRAVPLALETVAMAWCATVAAAAVAFALAPL
ncbi:MAG TPA: ABC transporter permease subunit, partial [Kofleriaceae bacterium]|nr:ABC transporter permease subunit [Kofleriaceae bacterium]